MILYSEAEWTISIHKNFNLNNFIKFNYSGGSELVSIERWSHLFEQLKAFISDILL